MTELRRKKRAKRVAIQKEGVDQDAAIGVEAWNKSRCRRGSRWGNAGERASIGLESAPVPFGTVVPAARSNPHNSCYEAVQNRTMTREVQKRGTSAVVLPLKA